MSHPELHEHASALLTRRFGRDVRLGDLYPVRSHDTVWRAEVESGGSALPQSVIVKRVTDTTFDQPGHTGPPQRFLNEWASLSFLTSLGLDGRVCPRLLAGDEDRGLLIEADLGDLPDLQFLLLANEPGRAREGMVGLGEGLGRLQAETRGRQPGFGKVQRTLGTGSPRCDCTVDQRPRRDLFAECLARLGLTPETGFWTDLMSVESEIHDDSPFWSMIHGDAGPQNLLIGVERGILIDFEFGVYRNGLCDVVGARLGFPQTSSAMGVPEDDAERLETAYRRAVAPGIPEAEVDDIFFRGLSAAAAHWALNRWAASWRHHLRPALDSGQDDLDVAALGSALLVWDGFTGLAATTARFPSLAGTVASYASELVRRWPGLEKPGTYPALRNS